MQRNRPFAVEIECGHTLGYNHVRNELARRGLDFTVGVDGSGVEVKAGPLSGPAGFRALRKVFGVLNEIGCYVTDRDGMHVHHDASEFVDNHEMLKKALASWVANRDVFHSLVAARRTRGGPCAAWTDAQVEAYLAGRGVTSPYGDMRAFNVHTAGPRGDLNFHALNRHGTIEIRLHEGSLDADVAEAWVKLGQNFLNNVARRKAPMPQCTIPELLQKTRVPYQARKTLLMKLPAEKLVELIAA